MRKSIYILPILFILSICGCSRDDENKNHINNIENPTIDNINGLWIDKSKSPNNCLFFEKDGSGFISNYSDGKIGRKEYFTYVIDDNTIKCKYVNIVSGIILNAYKKDDDLYLNDIKYIKVDLY
jgi:hypothetical protein